MNNINNMNNNYLLLLGNDLTSIILTKVIDLYEIDIIIIEKKDKYYKK